MRIATFPPGFNTPGSLSRKSYNTSNSLFTSIRSAWNTRWLDFRTASFLSFSGINASVSSITWWSPVVVSILPPLRIFSVIASAISSAYGSSEFSINMPVSSSFEISRSLSAALIPFSGFIRRSKGPSALNVKPRSGLSICIDDTPRSASTKSNFPASSATLSIFAKFSSFTVRISGPNPFSSSRFFVFADSIGSTSRP